MTRFVSYFNRCLSVSSSERASGVRRPASSSPGVAVVMVLGVLSVMVLMAVAFAISMRTERVAAGNYADGVRARQLVHTALARALDQLAVELGTNGLGGDDGGTVYPAWSVTNSWTNAYTNTSVRTNLLSTETANSATNFVPRALWAAARDADNEDARRHWLPIESVVELAPGQWQTNLMGRVKYLILNCSGLLDANWAGAAGSDRGIGADPRELAVGQLGELPTVPADFFANRAADFRYETQEELAALNAFRPTNFTVYSRSPAGYWTNDPTAGGIVRTQINLAGAMNPAELGSVARRDLIVFNLANLGFDMTERWNIYRNLHDYVDPDSTPESLSAERVPMINEMVFRSVTDATSAKNSVTFELWYPFVALPSNNNFFLNYEITLSAGPPLSGSVPFSAALNQPPLILGPYTSTDSSMTLAGQYTFTIVKANVSVGSAGGDVVDALTTKEDVNVTRDGSRVSYQCIDPRFNADMTSTNYWVKYANNPVDNLGKINTPTENLWGNSAHINAGGDTNAAMYVANTNLSSVGELGYLAYAPWKTIKLYGPHAHRVLDVFALNTNAPTADFVVTTNRGRFNPNSRQADAWAAVFAGMPVDQYPGEPGAPEVSLAAARQWYGILTNSAAYTDRYPFTNLSDFGRALNNFSVPGVTFDNELQREAMLRNAVGLLSVRQNLFTILIEAHVASGGNIPLNPIRQRAVALVWRDPYTGEMLVRNVKWLKD